MIGRERSGDGNHLRASVIHIGEVAAIGSCGLRLLNLGGHRRCVLLANSDDFRGPGSYLDTARAIEADPGDVFGHDAVVVDVVHDGDVHIVHGAVVGEVIAVPIAALVAIAAVAEAVVDSAVVTDVASPISPVPAILTAVVVIPPEARGPESAGIG